MNAKPSKHALVRRVGELLAERGELRLLDLGCGRAEGFLPLLDKPGFDYTGVEPSAAHAERAAARLAGRPNARVVHAMAPSRRAGDGEYDAVVSMSVLEHVKRLDAFLRFSADRLRAGGVMAHLYDLGHALTPATLREHVHVRAGSTPLLRELVPARRFVARVRLDRVCASLAAAGVQVSEVCFHNQPDHVRLLKALDDSPRARGVLEQVVELEQESSRLVADLPARVREPLFPSVCVWGRKA